MANPIFSSDKFRESAYSGNQPARGNAGGQFNAQPYGSQYNQSPFNSGAMGAGAGQRFEPYGEQQEQFGQQAQAQPERAMTFDDVMVKTLTVFGILGVGVVIAYLVPLALAAPLAIGGSLIGLVLGLVNAFKKTPSPALISLYAVAQGLMVGGWTRILELRFPGIGFQALIGTVAVFAVTFFLFRSGKVQASPKLAKFFMISLVSYLVYSLVNMVLSLTGVVSTPWGLNGIQLFGIPLGAIIGLFVIVLGAISLIFDFDQIRGALSVGAPAKMAWTCAFGLLVSVVWLYMEILRFLAIIRSAD